MNIKRLCCLMIAVLLGVGLFSGTALAYEAGDTVILGHYEQDNDTENGAEPIEWIVLEVQEDKLLLISRYGLDARTYHKDFKKVTWETCSLRTWLNDGFMEKAFTAEEATCILLTQVANGPETCYEKWKGNAGDDTEDYVFLLSYEEAWRYFSTDEERQCEPTPYAIARNGSIGDNGCCWWWLRSPGYKRSSATDVTRTGERNGACVDHGHGVVRPAMWVDTGLLPD